MAKIRIVRTKEAVAADMVRADDTEKAAKKVREKARQEVLSTFGVEKLEVEVDGRDRSVEVGESSSIDTENEALNDYLRESDKRKLVRSNKIDTEKLRALALTDKEVRKLVALATTPAYRVSVK